uniref:Predicted protein n=1 Tax=Hordeum vulgare subsp. vulgare TaxID=112509 RepID=F2E5F1_HORVV|nr:predicted protein [Hordeum vulgare subsp. vulgare]
MKRSFAMIAQLPPSSPSPTESPTKFKATSTRPSSRSLPTSQETTTSHRSNLFAANSQIAIISTSVG